MGKLLCSVLVCLLSSCLVPLIQGALTPAQQQQILDDHNNARRTEATPVANNMLKLKWDPVLAQVAQTFADTSCFHPGQADFSHNMNRFQQYIAAGGVHTSANYPELQGYGDHFIGENYANNDATAVINPLLSTKPNGRVYGGGAVNEWSTQTCWSQHDGVCTAPECSEEQTLYQDGSSGDGRPCLQHGGAWEHFVQTMYHDTQWVGCGWAEKCGTVCNYIPPGFPSTSYEKPHGYVEPYEVWGVGGAAASNCPHKAPYNDNGLCTDQKSSIEISSDKSAVSSSSKSFATFFEAAQKRIKEQQ